MLYMFHNFFGGKLLAGALPGFYMGAQKLSAEGARIEATMKVGTGEGISPSPID